MTTSEIIAQHLKPDWTQNLPDTETLRVLLDRIRDERGCGLKDSVWELLRRYEEINPVNPSHLWYFTERYSNPFSVLFWEGAWLCAADLLFEDDHTQGLAPKLFSKIIDIVESLGFNAEAVPD